MSIYFEVSKMPGLHYCVFPGCTTRGKKGLFQIPQKDPKRREWIEICALETIDLPKIAHLCIKHFKDEDLNINNPNRTTLKSGVKPFAPLHHYIAANEEVYVPTDENVLSSIKFPEGIFPKIEVSEHDYAKNTVHDPQKILIEKLIQEKKLFEKEVQKLEKEVKKLENSHQKLEKSVEKLEKNVEKWRNKYESLELKVASKSFKIQIAKEVLHGKATAAQIDILVSDSQRRCSKLTTQDDLSLAMKARCISPRVLKLFKTETNFYLVSKKTLQRKFAFMTVTPGPIKPSWAFLKRQVKVIPNNSPWRLVTVMFDEIKVDARCEYSYQLDTILGPNNYAQVLMVIIK